MRLLFLCGIIYIAGGSLMGCAAKQATKGEPKRSEAILPGANRIYPSQQSAQEARPGAGEAFPSSGGASSSYGSPSSSSTTHGSPSSSASTPYGSPSSPGTTPGAPSSGAETHAPSTSSSNPQGSASSPSTTRSPSTNTSSSYGVGSTPSREAAGPVYFSVQLWTSASEEKAKLRKDALQKDLDVPLRVVSSNGLYLVCAGEFSVEQEALALQRRAIAFGIVDARVITVPAVPSRP